jgi:phosphopantetheinyl transferase
MKRIAFRLNSRYVSEEKVASIFMVQEYVKQENAWYREQAKQAMFFQVW